MFLDRPLALESIALRFVNPTFRQLKVDYISDGFRLPPVPADLYTGHGLVSLLYQRETGVWKRG